MINYSFIIPHHNCPELLDRCLRSIPQRDDLEIIVVDDNSDNDRKPNIIRTDVKLINIDADHTKGAGRARNYALKEANGNWLVFADADDYFTDYLSSLLEKYVNDEFVDLVYLNACIFDEKGIVTEFKTEKLIDDYLQKKKDAEKHLRYNLWTPWSRMVKRNVVLNNNILFDEIPAGNDVMFSLKCSRFAKRIAVEKTVVYKYFKPGLGSNTDKARLQMIDSRLDLRGRMIDFYRNVGYDTSENLLSVIIMQRGVNYIDLMKKYKRALNTYKITMSSDVLNLLRRLIRNIVIRVD